VAIPEPQQPPDGDIVDRVLGGDTGAFELLMRRYNRRVYRTVRSFLRNEALAEDAVQESWLQAWKKLPQLGDGSAFGGWVARIAANQALGSLRRPEPVEPLSDEQAQPAGADDPESLALRGQRARAVEVAVDRLSQEQRSAFMLRDVEGLSTAEAAAVLGTSAEVVKVRLHRARAALRRTVAAGLGEAPAAFRFDGSRCDRMVARVMSALR
jgi:RNA polymerase sigma-70 factor (ECF subfamily)